MRKIKFMALLLTAALTLSCVAPTAVYAEEGTEGSAETTETATSVPYTLRTEQMPGQDEYDNNKVRVWLELDPTRAESISSYQISLQLQNEKGSAVPGRGMTLKFDEALEKAKIKESVFDPETQIMKIYVAAAENLVQFGKDENGNVSNKLPIGTVSVDKAKGGNNPFKIVLSDNDGDLITVDTGMNAVEVAEEFGADFEIPVDGAVYGQPVNFPLGITVLGKGTVKAYVVTEDGEELDEDGKVAESSIVRLSAIPAKGYRLQSLFLIDEHNKENKIKLGGDFKFEMESVIGVKAVFEKVEEKYTVTVGENARIKDAGTKKEFLARAVATVLAKAPEGQKFSCWHLFTKDDQGNVTLGDIVSYDEEYSFVVASDVSLIPEFVAEEEVVEEAASVVLNGATCAPYNGKYRISYSCAYSLPEGCELVQRGIIYTNQVSAETTDLDKFELNTAINGVKNVTGIVTGTAAQFIFNINNVNAGVNRIGRAFLKYKDKEGAEQIIYSTNTIKVTTPSK